MLTYARFHPEHLTFIRPYDAYKVEAEALATPEYAEGLRGSQAVTAFLGALPIGAAGVVEIPGWDGRALAWAVFSPDAGPHMLAITRKVRRVLDLIDIRRIELQVPCEFKLGHSFARLTGFTLETPCKRAFFADGRDAAEYVRIR